MAGNLLILGASARAAAASARRAGLTPFAIDLFADADTERICERVWKCPPDEYPHGLFALAKQAPPGPWMYTGGLENYPEMVRQLARERELWGNGPEVIAACRKPGSLASYTTLPHIGFRFPRVILPGESPPGSGCWLRKPIRSAGGRGIRTADRNDLAEIVRPGWGFVLEEFIPGASMSASFASAPASCELLAVTHQLIGTPWLHSKPFGYAGNVLVTNPEDPVADFFVGMVDAGRPDMDGLGGLWGIDFIRTPDRLFALEINPRYTASLETVEFSGMRSSVSWLMWACGVQSKPSWPMKYTARTVGKAIYYAPRRITFPASGPWDDSLAHCTDVWRRPDFADIPHPGDVIEPGHPVITLLADADTEAECVRRLQSRAAELDALLGVPAPPEDPPR